MTLIEVLTRHLPVWDRARRSAPEVSGAVPEPFREIARHCLQVDAGERWTVGEILHRVDADRAEAAPRRSERVEPVRPGPALARTETVASAPASSRQQKEFTKWPYLLGLVAVVVVVLFWIAKPKTSSPPVEEQSTQGSQSAETSTSQRPKPNPSVPGDANTATTSRDNQNDVVRQVMPQVSPSARRTIQGTIKVRVRVGVDAAGNVAKTKFELSGPSQYFSRVALEAAREWKFAPARADEPTVREWKLQFAFSRAKTGVSATRAKR
jgi:TonB family protein